jgi:hypothetical protein
MFSSSLTLFSLFMSALLCSSCAKIHADKFPFSLLFKRRDDLCEVQFYKVPTSAPVSHCQKIVHSLRTYETCLNCKNKISFATFSNFLKKKSTPFSLKRGFVLSLLNFEPMYTY